MFSYSPPRGFDVTQSWNVASILLIPNSHHRLSQRRLIADAIICLWDFIRTKVKLRPHPLSNIFGSAHLWLSASVSFVDSLGRLSVQRRVNVARQHPAYM